MPFFTSSLSTCLPLLPYTTLFRSRGRQEKRRVTAPTARDDVGVQCHGGVEGRDGVGEVRLDGIEVAAWRDGKNIGRLARAMARFVIDRKSTRLNSSHLVISYAVFYFLPLHLPAPPSLHDALPISRPSGKTARDCPNCT